MRLLLFRWFLPILPFGMVAYWNSCILYIVRSIFAKLQIFVLILSNVFQSRNVYSKIIEIFKENCLLLKLTVRTGTYRDLLSAIWVLLAQWLERLTGDQKVAGSIPVWGSETFFWVCDKAWVRSKQFSFNLPSCKPSFIHIN